MDGHPYGGGGNVNVDSCEKCGVIWLDGSELRRMAAAPDLEQSWFAQQEAEKDPDQSR